jgi:hypothetical protein
LDTSVRPLHDHGLLGDAAGGDCCVRARACVSTVANCSVCPHCAADAGKSTLAGSILFLTGNVDKRTIEKFEREAKDRNRESWYLAYIMDTNEEERAKGKTVEVGRATFGTTNKRCVAASCGSLCGDDDDGCGGDVAVSAHCVRRGAGAAGADVTCTLSSCVQFHGSGCTRPQELRAQHDCGCCPG